jgi:hypothetical protein
MKKKGTIRILALAVSITGILLLVYSFICRLVPIYFFWESRITGFWMLMLGGILLLLDSIYRRKPLRKNVVWHWIGISSILLILLIESILMIVIANSRAYQVATEFISTNPEVQQELGVVTALGYFPTGWISINQDPNGEFGDARIYLIIKGEKAFANLKVILFKDYDTEWTVSGIE